jgi:hypothetical protein
MPSATKQALRGLLGAQAIGNVLQGIWCLVDEDALAKQGGGQPFYDSPREPIQCIGLAMLAVSAYTLSGVYHNDRRSYVVTCFIRALYALGAFIMFERVPGQVFVRPKRRQVHDLNIAQLTTYESAVTLLAGALVLM